MSHSSHNGAAASNSSLRRVPSLSIMNPSPKIAGLQMNEVALDSSGTSHLQAFAPVTSLDQLYFQAGGMDIVLKRKVQQWALLNNGLFAYDRRENHSVSRGNSDGSRQGEETEESEDESRPRFVRWLDVVGDPEQVARVRFAKLKSTARCIEKLLRSYSGDVSRLVDICRQTIVFEEISHITHCLQTLSRDHEACIVRVKNRLHPEYQSDQSSGYRDVCINLMIRTEETEKLGISNHVCELQLILKRFAELKNNAGHRNYVLFRNVRGE
mmetsp:Transcript_16961/g.26269  ORF Transcript_16961/g.26269 Transcript_16961/m.26269 type:complete len:269 (+) Transcript_16961:227-1033(+)